jgi:integrase/recombinase XerD
MAWLSLRADLGLADRNIAAYAGGLSEYLDFCTACHVDPLRVDPSQIARFVHHLMNRAPANLSSTTYSSRLANATVQQRLTVIRLFYDYLVEEDLRATNPVGRGRPGQRRGLLPRFKRLP